MSPEAVATTATGWLFGGFVVCCIVAVAYGLLIEEHERRFEREGNDVRSFG